MYELNELAAAGVVRDGCFLLRDFISRDCRRGAGRDFVPLVHKTSSDEASDIAVDDSSELLSLDSRYV